MKKIAAYLFKTDFTHTARNGVCLQRSTVCFILVCNINSWFLPVGTMMPHTRHLMCYILLRGMLYYCIIATALQQYLSINTLPHTQ